MSVNTESQGEDPDDLSSDYPSFYFEVATLIDSLILTPSLTDLIPNLPTLHTYTSLTAPSKVLYIRLYLRKRAWLKSETLTYKEVSDITASIQELVNSSLLQKISDDTENLTVSELLETFSARKLKDLCKDLKLQSTGNLTSMKNSVLRMCKNQRSLFGGVSYTTQRVKKKCCQLLDDMVKISETPAVVLDKVLIASFPQHLLLYEEDEKMLMTGQHNLSRILLSQFQVTRKFPTYEISWTKPLFSCSHQLETFLSACQLEAQCHAHTQKHEWEKIEEILKENLPRYKEIVKTCQGATEKPRDVHLLRFTEEWVLTRVMRQGLAALQRLRKYEEAASLIELLLGYTPMWYKRGSWWENLALIHHFHLKKPDAARTAVLAGLADPLISRDSRIALELRLSKLYRNFTPEFTFEPKTVNIDVVALEGSGSAANSKKIWLGDNNGETVLCGVEDVTLNYYINNFDFKEGFHCEGSVLSTLFSIICWDILFSDVDNVFYNQYQYSPLDLNSRDFYTNRKKQFDEYFAHLSKLSEQEISDIVTNKWELYQGTGCDGLNWDLFSDLDQCKRCVVCITPPKLVKLFEIYVEDVRGKRSGIPDLSVWNYETREFAMVEVKGPGDCLSNKQRVWLRCLDEIGIRAELCLVKAISSKKLR